MGETREEWLIEERRQVESMCDRCRQMFKPGERRHMVGSAAMFSNLWDAGYRMVHEKCPKESDA